MSKILSLAFLVVSYIAWSASIIWTMVEFMTYLFKDKIFNWWSVWSIIICFFYNGCCGSFLCYKRKEIKKIF